MFLRYDPETGIFYRLTKRGSKKVGDIAGRPHNMGYVTICFDGQNCLAHRLAWLYMTGEWPTGEIDHWDLCRNNNRWANLRDATRTQNARNRVKYKNNTTGFKGVSYNKHAKKFNAFITVDLKRHYLGCFDSAEQAYAAYCEAAIIHHGSFARAA